MRILILGNKRSDHCSEVHYWKTFLKMGHEVVFLQESEATGADIIRNSNVDAFFFIHTHGWVTPGIDGALEYLKEKGVPTFGYHLDLYFGLKREPQIHDYITKLQHFFTVDKLMADWLNENTQTKGCYLPAGCFEDESYMAESNREKYPHDIVFTGSATYHSEYPYRNVLINWLKETYGTKFAHYGGGGLPGLRGHELNVMYASSKIVIGDTLCKDFKYPFYFSDRAFEVPCRGGFMIFPKIQGIEIMYDENREMIFYEYNNFLQLKEKIDYYLSHEEEREAIRLAGHKRAKESHNYTRRMEFILETLFGINNANPYEGSPYDCPPIYPINDEFPKSK